MPRRKFQFIRGGYYHIYNRGAARQAIFRNDEHYLYLLRLLKQVTTACNITVIAYCLLPNHYHWLLRQDGDIPAGKAPARVFGSYSQAFNQAEQRTGTLFEGPYQGIYVHKDEYLRQLCRYIHVNPVRAWPGAQAPRLALFQLSGVDWATAGNTGGSLVCGKILSRARTI